MTPTLARRIALVAVLALLGPSAATRALAAEGELRWGLHVTLAARWLDHELAFFWGVGPRVEVSGAKLIPGHAYSAPFEDLKLKR